MVNHVLADLAEGSEGSEGSSDQDVLAHGSISLLVFNLLGGGDVDESKVGLKLGVALLEVLEGLGDLFLEFGSLGTGLLHKLGCVEHSRCSVLTKLIIINKQGPDTLIIFYSYNISN